MVGMRGEEARLRLGGVIGSTCKFVMRARPRRALAASASWHHKQGCLSLDQAAIGWYIHIEQRD